MTEHVTAYASVPYCYNYLSAFVNNSLLSSRNYEPFYVDVRFASCSFDINLPMLADTGADDTMISKDCFPPELMKYLTPSNLVTVGVGGARTKSEGCFKATTTIGGLKIKDITVHIMDSKVPPLLGRDVLKAPGLRHTGFEMDQHGNGLYMELIMHTGGIDKIYKEPIIAAPRSPHDVQRQISWNLAKESVTPELNSLSSKLQYLKEKCKIELKHKNKDYLDRFAGLLIEYEDILGLDGKLGEFPHDVRIPTTGESKRQNQHPIPQKYKDKIGPALQKMLTEGVIEHCPDPKGFASPILPVPKGKNGEDMRLCVNYKRTLNKVLKDCDPYQMPSTDDCFNRIGIGNKFFTTADMKSGYWQIRIHPEDRYKTAFSWEGHDHQYVRMPFGLATAGAMFSRAISKALEEVSATENLTVYLDDTLVHGRDFESYFKAHQEFFSSLRRSNLKLNPAKCHFLQSENRISGSND